MKVVSEVLNPFFAIFYLFAVIFAFIPEAAADISAWRVAQFFSVIFGVCFLLPLLVFLLLRRAGLVSNTCMSNRKERIPIIIATAASYVLSTFLAYRVFPDVRTSCLILLLCAASWVVCAMCICNLFWKVSIHAAGMAGCCGLLLALSHVYPNGQMMLLPCALCLGLVVTSRWYLKRHTALELLSGTVIGFLMAYASVFLVHSYFLSASCWPV